jgi:5-methylcytosine-specific restriction endonuclease McrA
VRAGYRLKLRVSSALLNGYRQCVTCGAARGYIYTGGRQGKYCDPCRQSAYRAQKKADTTRRKARERGALVEVFDPIEVLQRDRWRCQHCRVLTPQSLRGTVAANAPELDHIVPISEGGEHSRRNTQCLCRSCNQRKGAGSLGEQLRLIG